MLRRNRDAAIETIGRSCYAVRARKLSRVMTRIYDDALRPLGVSVAQVNMLTAIGMMQEPSPQQVSEALDIEKSTLSRNLTLMESRGWIAITPSTEFRGHCLTLTQEGRTLMTRVLPLWRKAQRRAKKTFSAGLLTELSPLQQVAFTCKRNTQGINDATTKTKPSEIRRDCTATRGPGADCASGCHARHHGCLGRA